MGLMVGIVLVLPAELLTAYTAAKGFVAGQSTMVGSYMLRSGRGTPKEPRTEIAFYLGTHSELIRREYCFNCAVPGVTVETIGAKPCFILQ